MTRPPHDSRPRYVAALVGLLVSLALLAPVTTAEAASPAPAPAASALTAAPAKWTTSVFSRVPSPGYPAYAMVHRNGRVYAASYVHPDSRQRSRVFEWTRDGTLTRSWTVPGQVLTADHGVQVAQQTRDGRLVLLETSTRAVLTLDLRSGRFQRIARLPRGSVPNYATWGPRGQLFVTDYAKGTIWRVTRRGRTTRFFSSAALRGTEFGTTGIVYRPRRRDLLITQQTSAAGPPTTGALFRLPLLRNGRAGRLGTLWTSRPGDLPDGFGIGRSGHVYIALTGPNQLVELTSAGREVDRFPELPLVGGNGSAVPFDNPCSATFLGTRVMVANQSVVSGDPDHQALLAVEVGERGRRTFVPRQARFR